MFLIQIWFKIKRHLCRLRAPVHNGSYSSEREGKLWLSLMWASRMFDDNLSRKWWKITFWKGIIIQKYKDFWMYYWQFFHTIVEKAMTNTFSGIWFEVKGKRNSECEEKYVNNLNEISQRLWEGGGEGGEQRKTKGIQKNCNECRKFLMWNLIRGWTKIKT